MSEFGSIDLCIVSNVDGEGAGEAEVLDPVGTGDHRPECLQFLDEGGLSMCGIVHRFDAEDGDLLVLKTLDLSE